MVPVSSNSEGRVVSSPGDDSVSLLVDAAVCTEPAQTLPSTSFDEDDKWVRVR
jgi:hypothetical protein